MEVALFIDLNAIYIVFVRCYRKGLVIVFVVDEIGNQESCASLFQCIGEIPEHHGYVCAFVVGGEIKQFPGL